jgi:hypothetical protein
MTEIAKEDISKNYFALKAGALSVLSYSPNYNSHV